MGLNTDAGDQGGPHFGNGAAPPEGGLSGSPPISVFMMMRSRDLLSESSICHFRGEKLYISF